MNINIEACRPALTRHKNSEKYKEKHDDKHSCKQTGTHKTSKWSALQKCV